MAAQEQAQADQGKGAHESNPVPAFERFRIETTTVDGRGYSLLVCRPCGHRVRLPSGSGLFRFADLSQITEASAAHICRTEARQAGPE